MTNKDKIKICWKCPESLWKRIKYLEMVQNRRDIHKLMDDLIKKGLEAYKDDFKRK